MNTLLRHAAALAALASLWGPAVAGPKEVAESAANTASGVVVKVEKAIARGVKAAASGVERGMTAAASGVERGAKAAAGGVERGVKAAASGVGRGARATSNAADTAARKVGVAPASAPADGK
jgi:phage-related protein